MRSTARPSPKRLTDFRNLRVVASTRAAVRPGAGIDLGSTSTVIALPRRGVIVDQPSVVAGRQGGERGFELIASGAPALAMMGRSPGDLSVLRPVRSGAVTDLEPARALLSSLVRQLQLPSWSRWRPRAVLAVPGGATALERNAYQEVASEAGFAHVDLVPAAIAGAVGAGVDPRSPKAHLVLDLGGGTSELTAFAAGGILASAMSRVGGDDMTAAVIAHLRSRHLLLVGEETAESLKVEALSGSPSPLEVAGVELVSGRPRCLVIQPEEILESVAGVTAEIVRDLSAVLESHLPPQACTDAMADGITAFGAASLSGGTRRALEAALGIPVRVAEAPRHCAALGAAACLDDRDLSRMFPA